MSGAILATSLAGAIIFTSSGLHEETASKATKTWTTVGPELWRTEAISVRELEVLGTCTAESEVRPEAGKEGQVRSAWTDGRLKERV